MSLARFYPKLITLIIGVPNDYLPSEKATEVIDLLHTPNIKDLVNFFKRVVILIKH